MNCVWTVDIVNLIFDITLIVMLMLLHSSAIDGPKLCLFKRDQVFAKFPLLLIVELRNLKSQ